MNSFSLRFFSDVLVEPLLLCHTASDYLPYIKNQISIKFLCMHKHDTLSDVSVWHNLFISVTVQTWERRSSKKTLSLGAAPPHPVKGWKDWRKKKEKLQSKLLRGGEAPLWSERDRNCGRFQRGTGENTGEKRRTRGGGALKHRDLSHSAGRTRTTTIQRRGSAGRAPDRRRLVAHRCIPGICAPWRKNHEKTHARPCQFQQQQQNTRRWNGCVLTLAAGNWVEMWIKLVVVTG